MREYIVNLAVKFSGIPYIWGGNNPRIGFDCSGFVIWILQVFGVLKGGDWNALMLSGLFHRTQEPQKGDLVFYGERENAITHVMMYFGRGMVIGASGGGHLTLTPEDAAKKNAMVKIKPIDYRSDLLFICDIERPIDA
jgi:cell wall-associated NlpC family hydrolase